MNNSGSELPKQTKKTEVHQKLRASRIEEGILGAMVRNIADCSPLIPIPHRFLKAASSRIVDHLTIPA
jgi:hypothetical protein